MREASIFMDIGRAILDQTKCQSSPVYTMANQMSLVSLKQDTKMLSHTLASSIYSILPPWLIITSREYDMTGSYRKDDLLVSMCQHIDQDFVFN